MLPRRCQYAFHVTLAVFAMALFGCGGGRASSGGGDAAAAMPGPDAAAGASDVDDGGGGGLGAPTVADGNSGGVLPDADPSIRADGGGGGDVQPDASALGDTRNVDGSTPPATCTAGAHHLESVAPGGCEFAIPVPMIGAIDFTKVAVRLTGPRGTTEVAYVGSADRCDPGRGGWHYDIDPAAGTPTRVRLCESTCNQLKGSGQGLQLVFGCVTKV